MDCGEERLAFRELLACIETTIFSLHERRRFSITGSPYFRALNSLTPKTKQLGLIRKEGRREVYEIVYAEVPKRADLHSQSSIKILFLIG